MRTPAMAAEAAVAGEEEEEEEEFYESLDRILSSSCSSTSASDDDAGDHHRQSFRHRLLPALSASYDVWISEPSSVEERRRRLLQQLGLAGDPALSRSDLAIDRYHRDSDDGSDSGDLSGDLGGGGGCGGDWLKEVEIGRSISSDGLPNPSRPAAAFARSRSDGSVDPNLVQTQPSLRRPRSFGFETPAKQRLASGISLPPVRRDRTKSDAGDDDDRRCTIKNLDDGSEFVVKEPHKLREVGTGRQLTMEEFEMCVGRSPIVQELMRRQTVEESDGGGSAKGSPGPRPAVGTKSKKKGGWLRSIKSIAGTVVTGGYYHHHHRERRSSDEKDASSENGRRKSSSSATEDSGLEASSHSLRHGSGRVRVRQYGKSYKELTGLYMSQEIQAHSGSIWSIKFSLDGRYLASAGEDCVIHVWEVTECERKNETLSEGMAGENGNGYRENGNCYSFLNAIGNMSPEPAFALNCVEGNHSDKKRRTKVPPSGRKSVSSVPGSRKSMNLDHLMVPEGVFALSEKPVFSFRGHLDDVLDLSWSKTQFLLSSSMDKTVRLWHMSSESCLKTFTHSDYVTCIQFNPVDDRYFISGSLDEKVRVWSIPDRQVADWNDLHEMITAACYSPDGQGALVGSHKGSCHMFDTSENKLHHVSQIDLNMKKKKSRHKKLTGFQFAPGSSKEVLITSADSRIRVVTGTELVHKFKGFRNTSSQISASFTASGKYVTCASEDSHVYVWRYDADSQPSRGKGVASVTQSYEHFHCQDVTVAVTWPGSSVERSLGIHSHRENGSDVSRADPDVVAEANGLESPLLPVYSCNDSPQRNTIHSTNASHFGDRASATWPEEKLLSNKSSPQGNGELCNGAMQVRSGSAWGMVIVTAGRGGEIRIFQNFGLPLRV